MTRWAAAGIDTVRIQVRWVGVAPEPDATRPPPFFDAADPDDPRYDWAYLDRAIGLVVGAGMKPILAVTGSGPLWSSRVPSLGNPRYQPDPVKFGQFAGAVARRYGAVADRYLIWNEPNQPLWLQPQQQCPDGARRCIPVAPHTYRELVRAAYPAIHRADPGAQVIAGSLAPRGAEPRQRNRPLRPLAFIRAFGCVNERFKPIRTGRCRGFQPARIDGFAYHPHAITASPTTPSPHADDASIADLRKLEDTLDAVQRAARLHHADRRPHAPAADRVRLPDQPARPLRRRAARPAVALAAAGRVHRLARPARADAGPVRLAGRGRAVARDRPPALRRLAVGPLYADGRAKPALRGFQHPFFADVDVRAPRVRFWGQVRPGAAHDVLLQRRSPSGTFVTVARLRTDRRGTFVTTLDAAVPGRLPLPHARSGPGRRARQRRRARHPPGAVQAEGPGEALDARPQGRAAPPHRGHARARADVRARRAQRRASCRTRTVEELRARLRVQRPAVVPRPLLRAAWPCCATAEDFYDLADAYLDARRAPTACATPSCSSTRRPTPRAASR